MWTLVKESTEATRLIYTFLKMVLYFMERKQHFSGAGVWNNENKASANLHKIGEELA